MSLLLLFNRRRKEEPAQVSHQGGKKKKLRPRLSLDDRRQKDKEYWLALEDDEILVILMALKGYK